MSVHLSSRIDCDTFVVTHLWLFVSLWSKMELCFANIELNLVACGFLNNGNRLTQKQKYTKNSTIFIQPLRFCIHFAPEP